MGKLTDVSKVTNKARLNEKMRSSMRDLSSGSRLGLREAHDLRLAYEMSKER